MAGVLPGLLLGLTLAALCLIIAKKRNFPKGERDPAAEALKICVDALWGLMTMVIILGGILSGVFTATESPPSRCSGRFSSRCSSTATTSGATCPSWCTARSRR
jgi:TRAP-type mannitol/chloroaromatic compound transport system permease large subunit